MQLANWCIGLCSPRLTHMSVITMYVVLVILFSGNGGSIWEWNTNGCVSPQTCRSGWRAYVCTSTRVSSSRWPTRTWCSWPRSGSSRRYVLHAPHAHPTRWPPPRVSHTPSLTNPTLLVTPLWATALASYPSFLATPLSTIPLASNPLLLLLLLLATPPPPPTRCYTPPSLANISLATHSGR